MIKRDLYNNGEAKSPESCIQIPKVLQNSMKIS